MNRYTLEELIAMNNEALAKAARRIFSMPLDPFSELGKRTMMRRLQEARCIRRGQRISPALVTIIGAPSVVIENILDYQEALGVSEC